MGEVKNIKTACQSHGGGGVIAHVQDGKMVVKHFSKFRSVFSRLFVPSILRFTDYNTETSSSTRLTILGIAWALES